MASEGGGKAKSKRTQHSNKPYERRSSLLGKLKSSVKDLFVPSWLSWSADKDATDAQTSDNQGFSQVPTSDGGSQNVHGVHGNSSSALPINSHGYPRLTSIDTFQTRDNLVSVPLDSITADDGPAPNVTLSAQDSGLSFRGKGASVPNPAVRKQVVSHGKPESTRGAPLFASYSEGCDIPQVDQTPVRPIMVSTSTLNRSASHSKSESEKRLWSPDYGRKGRPLVPPAKDKPAFNSSLFGNLSKNESFSVGDSSFYAGKTRFGGASAERKRPLNQSLPYQSSLPLRKQVRASKQNASFQATTSATAQRILETLDKMSTPLGDAKKIPKMDTSNDSILSFTPSSYRRTSIYGSSSRSATRPLQLPSQGPPTNQYQIPSHAAIAKNRYQPSVAGANTSTKAPNSPPRLLVSQEAPQIAQRSSESDRVGPPAVLGSASGKMKTKKFSQHISSNVAEEVEVVEVPNLRTDFTLPVDKLTSIPLQTSVPPLPPTKSHTVAYTSIPSSNFPSDPSPLKFTFSTPIQEKRRPMSGHHSGSPDTDFQFSSPIQAQGAKTSAAGAEEGSKSSPEPAVGASSIVGLGSSAAFSPLPVPAWGSTAPKPKMASPDIGGTSSSFKSYTKWGSKNSGNSAAADVPGAMFPIALAGSLKTGSVMDILGKASSGSTSASGQAPKNDSPEKTKDSFGSSAPLNPPQTDDLMAKFRKPAGSWECDTCMVVNKPEAASCVACETPKPGAKPAVVPTPASTAPAVSEKPPLSALFKKPSGAWECDVCMVQNTSTAVRCVACETPKPGQQSHAPSSSSSNSVPLSVLFKKPAGNWECDTCMVQNTATADRCIACESPKPGLQAAGIVAKPAVPSSSGGSISIAPTGGFTINLPSTTTTTTGSGGFKFGTAATAPSSSSSAPQGGFKFASSSDSSSGTAPSGGFQFGAAKTETLEKTSTAPTGGFKFGSTASDTSGNSSNVSAGGFQFGSSSSASSGTSGSTGGFKFESSVSSNSGESSGSQALPGGFSFGVKEDKSKTTSAATFGCPIASESKSKSLETTNSAANTFSVSQKPLFGGTSVFPRSSDIQNGGTHDSSKQTNVQTILSSSQNGSVTTSVYSPFSGASQQPVKTNPSSSLFAFGATVSTQNATGLGMGSSLTSTPLVNGSLSSEFQPPKEMSKPSSGFGLGTSTPVFGGLGQAATQNGPSSLQGSASNKRSVDLTDAGAPSAKKSVGAENATNGPFSFGGTTPSNSASTFGSLSSGSPASFAFGQSSGNGPTTTGFGMTGTSFGQPASGAQPAASSGFFFKPQESGIGNGPSKASISFNATPSFNFGGASQPASSGTPFQFGAKPAESGSGAPAPSGGLFQFGGPSTGMGPTPSAMPAAPFSAPSAPGAIGNFTLGSSDSGARKMKKAVRRLKK